MPLGTTLLHSPGWRECQRHEQNPGDTGDTKTKSSVGAALSVRAFIVDRVVPPLKGLNKCVTMINPGLAPWAMQECRPCRAHLHFHHQSIIWLFWCESSKKEQVKLVLLETVGRSPIGVNPSIELTHSEFSAQKIVFALPKLKTSARSVQTSAEVCADYGWSLYRLQLKSPESTTYLQI